MTVLLGLGALKKASMPERLAYLQTQGVGENTQQPILGTPFCLLRAGLETNTFLELLYAH